MPLNFPDTLLGEKVVNRLICFVLYLLGVDRASIARLIHFPPGTVRSVIRAILRDGLAALEDRRRGSSTFLPPRKKEVVQAKVHREQQAVVVDLEAIGKMRIPVQNVLQTRAVLLTMLDGKLLGSRDVAEALNLGAVHTLNLAHKLMSDGIPVLIDKRQGQRQDYRFTPDVKAELIQQFVLDIVASGKASGKILSEHLEERCQLVLSERSIREHIRGLGLSNIKQSLPHLLAGLKKNRMRLSCKSLIRSFSRKWNMLPDYILTHLSTYFVLMRARRFRRLNG